MMRLRSIFSFFWVYGLSLQTAYVDVCDDTRYSMLTKSFNDKAAAANISAITTGGIYPGVSNGAMTNSYDCLFLSGSQCMHFVICKHLNLSIEGEKRRNLNSVIRG